MNKYHLTILITMLTFLVPIQAMAFCGFYANGKDAPSKLTNDATQVVIMRHHTKTILSMRNTYRGPLKDFAMIIPVPVVLKKSQVKTLKDHVFDKINLLSSPKLVQYWESNPCPKSTHSTTRSDLPPLEVAFARSTGIGRTTNIRTNRPMVNVETHFKQGEYDISILSTKDSSHLERWLRENKYNIPLKTSKALQPYVQQGMYFLVAKVNISKVKSRIINGKKHTILSPLRFHFDSKNFSLPVRLGLINANGMQDLIIHILAKSRYEVANAKNVTIPTNLIVDKSVLKSFGSFYNQLFDYTLKQNRGAVVTEYAWESTKCDPCPTDAARGIGGPLVASDLLSFGLDVLYPKYAGGGTNFVGVVDYVNGAPTKKSPFREMLLVRTRSCSRMLRRNRRNGELMVRVLATFNPAGKHQISIKTQRGKYGIYALCLSRRLKALSRQQLTQLGVNRAIKVSFLIRANIIGFSQRLTSNWVLTRLHTRYNANTLKSDLTFRSAQPIVGGRGMPENRVGRLSEEGAVAATLNQFQSRYIVLNHWENKRTCGHRSFQGWFGQPNRTNRVRSAQNLAFTPRKKGLLASMIKSKNKPGLSWFIQKKRQRTKSKTP